VFEMPAQGTSTQETAPIRQKLVLRRELRSRASPKIGGYCVGGASCKVNRRLEWWAP